MDKRVWIGAGLVLLLLLLTTGIYSLSKSGGDQGAPQREAGPALDSGTSGVVAGAPPVEGDPTAGGAGEEGPGEEPGAAAAGKTEALPGAGTRPAQPTAVDIDSLPPAVRPNPRTPPPPRPGTRSVGPGSRPPMGPTGLWEKFPPRIPRGRASLEAVVLDLEGSPVHGATVYIGPPERAGEAAVSFGDLRQVGKTDAAGKVRADRLPEGAASVAANLDNLLNGRRGLDMRTAVKVALLPGSVALAEVRLPFSLSEFGGVRGVVMTGDGEPLGRASVITGFHRVYTDGSGAFSFPRLRVGTATVAAS